MLSLDCGCAGTCISNINGHVDLLRDPWGSQDRFALFSGDVDWDVDQRPVSRDVAHDRIPRH